jgi:hypothetical protein
VAWLTLGIASVALALIAVVVLRSERESTAILHHMNIVTISLQNALSDLAGAEAEQRGYFLTSRPTNLENLQRCVEHIRNPPGRGVLPDLAKRPYHPLRRDFENHTLAICAPHFRGAIEIAIDPLYETTEGADTITAIGSK